MTQRGFPWWFQSLAAVNIAVIGLWSLTGCPTTGGGGGGGEQPQCAEEDGACEGDADCCTGLDCIDGTCQTPAEDGTLAGTVTNELTGTGIAGATVTLDPVVEGLTITTGDDGTYTAVVAPGEYSLTFTAENFEEATETATVTAGATTTVDAALTPSTPVAITITTEGEVEPGGSVTVTAGVAVLDPEAEIISYSWAQSNSVAVTIENADTASPTVILPDLAAYKDELFQVLAEPPITAEQLPENVPPPEGEFPGGLQDRFYVVGLNPFTLEETGLVTLELTVETSAGEFVQEVELLTELPWKPASGLHNVPPGIPVVLHGKTQDAYDWALDGPDGSSATLADATSQTPYFTPDVSGTYSVTVTDSTVDPAEEVTLEIVAGTWAGAITGQDDDGRPVAANCTACHNGTIAPDMFTPWAQTGHAEIFKDNLNTNDHYSTACLSCHTVGYDPDVDNGGFDNADDFDAFMSQFTTDGTTFVAGEDNYDTLLADFPATAQLGNIQCENCHGPQNGAHMAPDARISLSSDVCAVCHGEPLRHGRYQQWQLSGHANYELALEEGENGSCGRCHTVNGFLAWLPILLDDDPETDPTADIEVTWTADEIHPQTCVTCHDPHSIGTTTGTETDATVRISGDTPPLIAGFTATDVGRGAICMTCHNTRRGLRNDDTFDDTVAAGETSRAPHGSAQTDVLFGQNAYFVEVGTRGSHSEVADTCVTCHMVSTPPPDLLSYDLGGTNHTFFASADICADCHGEAITAASVQDAFQTGADELQGLIEEAMLDLIGEQIAAGNTIDLNGERQITDAAEITDLVFGEASGRQGFTVTFDDGATVGPVGVNSVSVLDGTGASLGELYGFADERLIKAGWNWNLANSDGSKGVHYPSFVTDVLEASIAQMTDLTGA